MENKYQSLQKASLYEANHWMQIKRK